MTTQNIQAKKLHIGVKYCGGCNSTYDRAGILVRLQWEYPGLWVTPAQATETYDIVLLLQGCSRNCANGQGLTARYGTVNVANEEDYEQLCRKIDDVMMHGSETTAHD